MAFPGPASDAKFDLLKGYPEAQPNWVGRVVERGQLSAAWLPVRKRIYAIVGFGGQGKSALARRFTETLRRLENPDDRPLVVWWSFYLNRSADEFFDQAAKPLNIPLHDEESDTRRNSEQIAGDIIERMRTGVNGRRVLLVLDGLEVLQETTLGQEGRIKNVALYGLLKGILDDNQPDMPASGMVLITTREPLTDLTPDEHRPFTSVNLDQLSITDGAELLINRYGLNIDHDEAEAFVKEVAGHALTLTLTGTLLRESGATSATLQELREFIASEEAQVTDRDVTTRAHRLPGYVLRHCAGALDDDHRQIMRLLSCCVRPATKRDIEEVFLHAIGDTDEEKSVNDKLLGRKYTQLRNGPIRHLCELRLIEGDEDAGYDMHPLIRRHFYEEETGEGKLTRAQRKAVHARFFTVLAKRPEKNYPDTMTEMEPLIDAVLHGCRADLADRAFFEVYCTRIGRKDIGEITFYLFAALGASETELQLLRAFFPDGDFNAEPRVSVEQHKAYLVSAAGLALMNTGRPSDAIPLFERGAEMRHRQSDWVNRSMAFQNLSGLFERLGRLRDAFEAAKNGLTNLEKVPASHRVKTLYTIFSHGWAAGAAAQRGEAAAAEHFEKAIDLHREDWLLSLPGAWHCTWLARSGDFKRARTAGEKNTAMCAEHGYLLEQTFVFATHALVERLAWAAGD
ncbi:MAG: ATP-binding protein, partial [Phycisphaerae bacterium]